MGDFRELSKADPAVVPAIARIVECFFFQSPAVPVWSRESGDCYGLWIAMEGRGRMNLGRSSQRIGPGNALLLRPGERIQVRQERSAPVRNFLLAMHLEESAAIRAEGPGLVRMNDLVGVTVLARKLIEAHQTADALSRAQSLPLAEALLLEFQRMRDSGERGVSPYDGRLLELANRIRLAPGEPWSVERCAREFGLCRSRFSRLFQRLTTHPPMRFIVKCRMQSAGRLLRESPLSVSEIADALGYRDVFYFSKHFRKEMGKAPTRYRADGW